MKKLLLSVFVASSFAANAQLIVFEDSFETYEDFLITGFGDWLTLDIDQFNTYTGGQPDGATPWPNAGAPQAWMIFNPSTANVTNDATGASGETRNFDPKTGAKYAASWASVVEAPQTNNDFLISPVLNLGASNNELTFWVKSMSDTYGLETFRVYVYAGTGTPTQLSDFTAISGLSNITAPFPVWEQKTYSLNAYSNQAIRVGIRNTGADHYMLMVDDFRVTSANLSVNEVLAGKFSTYPNPSNGIINLTNTESIQVNAISITDLNGRIVKEVKYTDAPENLQVNIADLASGMYLMNISSNAGVTTKKIVRN